MPPVSASRKFEIVTAALALAEERDGVALADAARILGVSREQLRDLLDPVLFLEYRDAAGDVITKASEFLLDEHDVLQVDLAGSNWLRDLAATAPSSEALVRLFLAATNYQATSSTTSPALDRALDTLRGLVAVEMVVPADRPAIVEILAEAQARRRSVRFRYVNFKDDTAKEREVFPYDLYYDWGKWMLVGPEVHAPEGPVKNWRLAGMQDVELADSTFDRPPPQERAERFDLSALNRTVTVRLPRHRLATLPRPHRIIEHVDESDDVVVATIEVAGTRQLDHLLVSLGPDGEVIEPVEYRDRRRREAKRLLAHVEAETPAG